MVGRRIAARLIASFPGRVVIAGRDEQRAAAFCRELGGGARPRRIDADDATTLEAGLDGIRTVVTCVTQADRHILRAAIDRGLAYTDIAADRQLWQDALELRARAEQTGARVLLGAGLTPGISNVMAGWLHDTLGQLDRIETAILLGLGDEFGSDSLAYMLGAMARRYAQYEDGRPRQRAAFSEGQRTHFPPPIGPRTAYLFPWPEVACYPATLGVATAVGRVALDPPWAGHLVSAFGTGVRKRIGRASVHRRGTGMIDRLHPLFAGHDRFALVVTGTSRGRVLRACLSGQHQAEATAVAAAEFARVLTTGEVLEPGVWLPEQAVSPDAFFNTIASSGYPPVLEGHRVFGDQDPPAG
jgi:saccharopine dehydrogenase (NAD+, L-lysine forming)